MEQRTKKKSPLSVLFKFAGNFKYLTMLSWVLSAISAVLSVMPFIYIWFTMRDIFSYYPNYLNATSLAHYGWMAVIYSVASILVYTAALMCSHISAFRIARNMRSQSLHHLVKLPLGYFTEKGSGRIRRIIDECSGQTETFLAHRLPDIVGALVTPIVLVVLLFVFDWKMGILSFIPILIGMFPMMKMMSGKNLKSSMEQYQYALEDMNNEAVEYVRGIPVVKTFQQTVFSFKNFHDSIMRYKKFVMSYSVNCRLPLTSFTVSINAIFALLIPGGILMLATAINPKEYLLSLIFYFIFTPLFSVMFTKIMFAGESTMMAADASTRVVEILEQNPLIESSHQQVPQSTSVEFSDVSFSYPGTSSPAIDNVTFEIPSGSTVALVGPSGGGKTTAASLIPRFWDVDSGEIKVGGVNIKQINTKALMNRVSFVFQDTRLIKTTLMKNITLGKPNATEKDVLKAIKAAQCEDIIEKMPNGIHTVVGTKGVYLSGGEVQRICLARAILKDAPIIILDEATAFADPENEHKIQLAFKELTKGKTVLMIAHRLSTVKNADSIIVFNKGKIVEKGTHENLVQNKGLYCKMWNEYQTSIKWGVGKESVCNG